MLTHILSLKTLIGYMLTLFYLEFSVENNSTISMLFLFKNVFNQFKITTFEVAKNKIKTRHFIDINLMKLEQIRKQQCLLIFLALRKITPKLQFI